MPLTGKGQRILGSMEKTYGSEKKGKQVFYASKNAGKISGVDEQPAMATAPNAGIPVSRPKARDTAIGGAGAKGPQGSRATWPGRVV
jgi:hypothetical protein